MTNSSIGVACLIVLCSEVGLYQGMTVVQGKGGVASIGISWNFCFVS